MSSFRDTGDKGEFVPQNKKNLTRSIIIITILLLLTAGFWLGLRFTLSTSNPLFVVTSGSMIPNLNINDVIVLRDGETFDSLEVGDIIIFHKPGSPNECVTRLRNCIVHRVNEINYNGGEKFLVTKGDANNGPDPWEIRGEDYIGKVIFVIPQLGLITRALEPVTSPPMNYILIAIVIGLIFLIELKSPKRKNKKEVESEITNRV